MGRRQKRRERAGKDRFNGDGDQRPADAVDPGARLRRRRRDGQGDQGQEEGAGQGPK